MTSIFLYDVDVQGKNSEQQIIDAIRQVNLDALYKKIDNK